MPGKLFEIASQVRQEFEADSIDRGLLSELYADYNPHAIGDYEFLDRAFRIFPVGCCGLTAAYLQHRFQQGEMMKGEYDGEGHTLYLPFNRIGNFIIDITADQFDGPPVYAGPIQAPWKVV